MQHQKIRPQTITPTTSAATHDQLHRVRIRSAWWVTPVGQPNRSFISASCAVHPVNRTIGATSRPIRDSRDLTVRRGCCPPDPDVHTFVRLADPATRQARRGASSVAFVTGGYLDAAAGLP